MNLEDVEQLWLDDGPIDETNLSGESANIPMLHQKYFKIYSRECLRLAKRKSEKGKLLRDKTEYYSGQMDKYSLEERGWEPFSLKILKADIPSYIEADEDIINLNLRINYSTQMVKFLEDILKQINNRSFQIKNCLDYQKFINGS